MVHFANHDASHGYTQGAGRWGNGESDSLEVDGTTYEIYGGGGDRDCSSGTSSAYATAGFNGGRPMYTWTGDEYSGLVANGFTPHSMSGDTCDDGYEFKAGDGLLRTGVHTAMCISDSQLAEFSINEYGTITGGQVGDQTGNECKIRSISGTNWNWCFECPTIEEEEIMTDQDKKDIAAAVWNWVLGKDGKFGNPEQMEAWRFVSWTNSDTASLNAELLGSHTRATDGLEGVKTRDQIDHMDVFINKTNDAVSELQTKTAELDSKLDAILKAVSK